MGKSGRLRWPNETEPSLTAESEAEKRRKPSRRGRDEEERGGMVGFKSGEEGSFTTTPSIIFLIKRFSNRLEN